MKVTILPIDWIVVRDPTDAGTPVTDIVCGLKNDHATASGSSGLESYVSLCDILSSVSREDAERDGTCLCLLT